MTQFPIAYDPEAHSVQVEGPGGATVLLNLLHAAKFSEPFNSDLLFNRGVAALLKDLKAASLRPEPLIGTPFTPSKLSAIAHLLLEMAEDLRWWHMDHADQVAFLQDVAAAPHQFSTEQIETIQSEVIVQLSRLKAIVEAVPPLSDEDRDWLEAPLSAEAESKLEC